MLENYRPGVVNKTVIAHDFGTTPEVLSQPYRHIVGIVLVKDRREFLKLSTAGGTVNNYTRNEAEILRRRENKKYPLPLATPTLRREGVYDYQGQKFSWFTTDYIESQELYTFTPENSANPMLFERYLSTIIDTAVAIMDWPQHPQMPLDVAREEVAHTVIDKVQGWINGRLSTPGMIVKAAKAYELQEQFFTQVDELEAILDTGSSHGDFVPNNFRITPDGQLYLMDLEGTRMNWLKFYDVAYMYHRLYTKYKNPELAKTFLKKFIARYSLGHNFNEREMQNFRIALAQRLIGGYFDATQDGVTSSQLQDELSIKLFGLEGSLEELQ